MKYSKWIILFYIRTHIPQRFDFMIYDYSKKINNEKQHRISYCSISEVNTKLFITEYLLNYFELIKYKLVYVLCSVRQIKITKVLTTQQLDATTNISNLKHRIIY